MRMIWIGCGLIMAGAAAWLFLAHRRADHYGEVFRGAGRVDVAALVGRPAEFLKKEVRIEGTLVRQCPSAGCWFFLRNAEGQEIRVEMGATTPRLPSRVGRQATVEGELIRFGDAFEFVGTAVEFH